MADRPLVVEPPGDEAAVRDAAAFAARVWGLPAPELVRIGMNGVLVAGEVVLRVSRATVPPACALDLADLLGAEGVRVARPARREVIEAAPGVWVTAWERIDHQPSAAVDFERVGAMIALVHQLDPERVSRLHPLPWCGSLPWWDFDAVLAEVDDLLDPAARSGIARCLDRHAGWSARARRAGPVVCHGDVHPGNVLVDDQGPVLGDWDLLCLGPPGWDHGPLLTWHERWGGEPGIYEAFAAGYGRSLRDDPIATAVAELRLVAATLLRLRAGRSDPQAAAEAERRLRWWRGDPHAPPWRAH
jgi:Ser/Thr protein kinase RdoA (MazF antagonist)